MNEIIEANKTENKLEQKLHELGFENEREYLLYLKLKKSIQQNVPIGIAS